MKRISFNVVQGQIIINSIVHVINTPNFHVFELDLAAKYAMSWSSHDTDGATLHLMHDARTLHVNLDTDITSRFAVKIPNPDMNLMTMVESPRYTARFVIWRCKTPYSDSQLLWPIDSIEGDETHAH